MTILKLVVLIFHSESHWSIPLSSSSQINDSWLLFPHNWTVILIRKLRNQSIRIQVIVLVKRSKARQQCSQYSLSSVLVFHQCYIFFVLYLSCLGRKAGVSLKTGYKSPAVVPRGEKKKKQPFPGALTLTGNLELPA